MGGVARLSFKLNFLRSKFEVVSDDQKFIQIFAKPPVLGQFDPAENGGDHETKIWNQFLGELGWPKTQNMPHVAIFYIQNTPHRVRFRQKRLEYGTLGSQVIPDLSTNNA